MKSFLNFKKDSTLVINRNGVEFKLIAATQEKGSKGIVPSIEAKSFDLEKFITWQCKNKETAEDSVMRGNAFNTFVIESFNNILTTLWKQVVPSKDYKPAKGVAKPEIVVDEKTYETYIKAFQDAISDSLGLVTKAREKNSVFYKKLASDLAKQYSKETDKEKKAALLLQAREAQNTAKTLEEQENKALDAELLEIIGEVESVTEESNDETDDAESDDESESEKE